MTIAQRMYALIFAAFIGLTGLTALGIYQIQRVFTATNYVSINVVPSIIVLNKAVTEFGKMRTAGWQVAVAKDPADQKKYEAVRVASFDAAMKLLDKYEKEDIADDKDRALLNADRNGVVSYKEMGDRAVALVMAGQGDEGASVLMKSSLTPGIVKAFNDHSDYNENIATNRTDEATSILGSAKWQASGIAVVVILAVAILGLRITRHLIKSLEQAIDVAETVAHGDLTHHIDATSSDEIGRLMKALQNMNEQLQKIVGQVRIGTETISTASQEIAQGNLDLSARTESQASSLEETAASMEELTSTVQQNSENTQQANQLAQTAADVAVKGGAVVAKVVDTMGAINDSAKKIVDIISVIDGIAFQTNILALNAAVEAARAGEQGRGFAVVATEVRNLAQRSASAAKEIKGLIGDSVEKVATGTKLVDDAGTTMTEVVSSIRRVTDLMAEINSAGREQSQGIAQVNAAVIEMDSVTQQNAALVEEAAAAAGSLQEQATHLSQLVSFFKIESTDTGHKTPVSARTVPATMSNQAHKSVNARPALVAVKQARVAARPRTALGTPELALNNGTDGWAEF